MRYRWAVYATLLIFLSLFWVAQDSIIGMILIPVNLMAVWYCMIRFNEELL